MWHQYFILTCFTWFSTNLGAKIPEKNLKLLEVWCYQLCMSDIFVGLGAWGAGIILGAPQEWWIWTDILEWYEFLGYVYKDSRTKMLLELLDLMVVLEMLLEITSS